MSRQGYNRGPKEYAAEFLESMYAETTCGWCKHPEEPLYRSGLCRHCYNISREISKFETSHEQYKQSKEPTPFELRFDLKTAREMARLAKDEGVVYGDIHKQNVTGVQLEYAFSALSKAFVKEDLYYQEANLFDWSFSLDQRRLIYYLLSKVLRKHSRRHRRQHASYRVAGGKTEREERLGLGAD